jgi:hypothetical protein
MARHLPEPTSAVSAVLLVASAALALGGCGGLEYYDPAAVDKSDSEPITDGGPGSTTPTVDTASTTTTTTTTDTGTVSTRTDPTPTTTTTTTTTTPVVLTLAGVSPHYGTTAGGTRVVATGSFDATTELLFDGVPGAVVSSTATELTVDTPAGAAGWVDVEAVSGTRSAPLASGFQYWTDGSGLTGAFGWFGYTEIVGGFWVGNPPDAGHALLGFSSPGTWEIWQDYAPVLDTCQFDYAGQGQPTPYDPGAAQVGLSSGAVLASIPADPTVAPGVYADPNLAANVEVVPGTVYDLDPVAGNADWPGFGVTGFVEVPPAFSVTSPNLGRASDPVDVTRTFTLTWSGGGGDYVLIWILRQYDNFGTWVDDGVVTCAVADTGTFTIPAGSWPNWFVGDFLHVQVGRVVETRAVLPHDQSEVRTAGTYWYYGAAESVRQ